MPPSAPRPRRSRSTARPEVVAEVAAGLLLGAVLGWVAGLLRVRTPGGAA